MIRPGVQIPSYLVRQTRAALGTTAGENLAAVGSSHSLAEAMDLLAVQLLGLIGTFRCHFETPPVFSGGEVGSSRPPALTRRWEKALSPPQLT